jgi:hypothetical protein
MSEQRLSPEQMNACVLTAKKTIEIIEGLAEIGTTDAYLTFNRVAILAICKALVSVSEAPSLLSPPLGQRERELEEEIGKLMAEGVPGVMHSIDKAFYELACTERNHARSKVLRLEAEIEALKQQLTGPTVQGERPTPVEESPREAFYRKALAEVREGIMETALDTVWLPGASPTTAVEYITHVLGDGFDVDAYVHPDNATGEQSPVEQTPATERTVVVDVRLADGSTEQHRFGTMRGNGVRCLQAIEEEAAQIVRREFPVEGPVKGWQWYFETAPSPTSKQTPTQSPDQTEEK